MKKQELHVFPLQTIFLKKIETGVQYYNENHYISFDGNSLEVTSFNEIWIGDSWPTDSILEKALKTLSLHNIKYLTKLKISIQASFSFKTSTIRHFGFSIARHFKTLKQLDLRFLSCTKVNSGNLRCLLDALTKGMGHLTEAKLYFLACDGLDDRCLEELKLSLVKRCKELRKFQVILAGEILRVDKGFLYFEPDLKKRLQNDGILCLINGWYGQNKITSEGGASLCRSIAQYLKKLRSFTFPMEASQQKDHVKLTKYTFQMMASLQDLEDLNLSVNGYLKIDDVFLEKLTSCIGKNLKKLQSLSLDFPLEPEITTKGYRNFAQNLFLSLPPHLTYFALNLESCCPSFTDDIVREIGLNIAKNLKNLQTLILSFSWNEQLTENALLGLIQTISPGLP